ncbi:MAG: hypothetical protein JXM74_01455 [Fusobacteriaceae bacterium]|nr:hypothetical protein [Fusobacteriaceae bacterium]MBN2837402.1 hypothetical protein [Fusobacteriaceae bacterium]
MKRTATLLAGLLLVTGTTFAAGTWSLEDTMIRVKTNLVDTGEGTVNDDSNEDTDLELQFNVQIDDKTKITLNYNTDDVKDSNYVDGSDNAAELLIYRKDRKIEAQFDAAVSFNGKDDKGNNADFIFEDQTSYKTYLKLNFTKDVGVSLYPFNMGLANGVVFDEDKGHTEIPGLVLQTKKGYIGIGMDAVDSENNIMALKAGYSFDAYNGKIDLKYSGAFWDSDEINRSTAVVGTAGRIGYITHDINVHGEFRPAKNVNLIAEAGINMLPEKTLYDADGEEIKSAFGLSVKGTFDVTREVSPYVQVKYTTDGFLAYEDMYKINIDKNTETSGLLELIGGVDYYFQDNVILNGEIKIMNAGEKVFIDNDGGYTSSALVLSAGAAYKF